MPVRSEGADNAMYRLGDDLAVRFPRRPSAVEPLAKECAWLPRFAPCLPLPVPLPIARGAPGEGYPWSWSVCRWLDGENPVLGAIAGGEKFATDLASFIHALQAIDAADGPRAGAHNFGRGAPLAQWRSTVRERLGWLADVDDVHLMEDAWVADSHAAPWDRPPVWIHGDLSVGNLLVKAGRLAGVIDWGALGAGDPACELQVAWTVMDQVARQSFRAAMGVDEATWTRGRAWGLAVGIVNLSYYRVRSPGFAEKGRRAITAVLADHARERSLD